MKSAGKKETTIVSLSRLRADFSYLNRSRSVTIIFVVSISRTGVFERCRVNDLRNRIRQNDKNRFLQLLRRDCLCCAAGIATLRAQLTGDLHMLITLLYVGRVNFSQ